MKKEDIIYLAGLMAFLSVGIALVVLIAINANNQAEKVEPKKASTNARLILKS